MFEELMYYPQNEDFWKLFGSVVNYQYLSLKIDGDKAHEGRFIQKMSKYLIHLL